MICQLLTPTSIHWQNVPDITSALILHAMILYILHEKCPFTNLCSHCFECHPAGAHTKPLRPRQWFLASLAGLELVWKCFSVLKLSLKWNDKPRKDKVKQDRPRLRHGWVTTVLVVYKGCSLSQPRDQFFRFNGLSSRSFKVIGVSLVKKKKT